MDPNELHGNIRMYQWAHNANAKSLMLNLRNVIIRKQQDLGIFDLHDILLAYVEEDIFDEQLLTCLAQRSHQLLMEEYYPSWYAVKLYYCFTKTGFKGENYTIKNKMGNLVGEKIN